MSHYTVGVIIKEEDIRSLETTENMVFEDAVKKLINEAMEPFDENKECEPRLSMTMEEVQNKFNEIVYYKGVDEFYVKLAHKYKDSTLEEFCNTFYGKTLEEDGLYTTYNQDSKWDWYVIGGRWNGCLPIKNEEKPSEGLDAYEDDIPNNCCKIKDLELRREASEEELKEMQERYEEMITKGNWFKPEYYKQKYPTFEAYKDNELEFSTYALLTSDGEWVEPGEMGWFGMSSASPEEEANFINIFRDKLGKENPENYFVLVDCHI